MVQQNSGYFEQNVQNFDPNFEIFIKILDILAKLLEITARDFDQPKFELFWAKCQIFDPNFRDTKVLMKFDKKLTYFDF